MTRDILQDDPDAIEVLSTQTFTIETPNNTVQSNENLIGRSSAKRDHRKLVARMVAVVSVLFIILSCALVGISFSMSKDIDEMVRNSNELLRRHSTMGTPVAKEPHIPETNVTGSSS